MGTKELLSKKRITDGLGVLGKMRIQISHAQILSMSALFLILFVAFAIRLMPMRWEVPSGNLALGEFDPYYQYSLANHMVQNGLLSPYTPPHWVNQQLWYPFGLDMGLSLPTLPMLAAILFQIVTFLGVNVSLTTFCSFLPAVLGTLSVFVLYFVGKDMGGKAVGMFSALFLALSPSVIQRSSVGFFDTETVGVLGLVTFILFFMRAIEQDRSFKSTITYSIASALAFVFFTGGWGAAYFLLGLISLFVAILVIARRYSQKLLLVYSLTFGLGLFLTINIPYLAPNYLFTAPTLAIAGVFVLLIAAEVLRTKISLRTKSIIAAAIMIALAGGLAFIYIFGDIYSIAGKFSSVMNPLTRAASPIIASVAEHKLSTWGTIYYELGISILFFLVGLYFVIRNPTTRNIFLLVFGFTTLYFAGSMVRLLVLLGPAFGLLAAVGITGLLKPFYTLLIEAPKATVKMKRRLTRVGKEYSAIAIFLIFIILTTSLAFSPQSGGQPRVYSSIYAPVTITAASLPVTPSEPVTAWLDMVKYTQKNLQSTTVVSAWWDYGDWLSLLGNVTTLCDNTTENTTQIENVGFSFMANETQSLKMLATYKADYVLVFITVALGSGATSNTYVVNFAGYGDEGKWSWMAQISGGAASRLVDAGFIPANESWTVEQSKTVFGQYSNVTNSFVWSNKGTNSTVYKLMSWAKAEWTDKWQQYGLQPDTTIVQPTYFNLTYCAGLDISPVTAQSYGGLVPLVALYQINWDKYYNDTSTAPIG